MSYQILPNALLFASIFGIILIFLRRLPDGLEQSTISKPDQQPAEMKLWLKKGLPTFPASRLRAALKLLLRKIWNFALEAKGLRPGFFAGYRMKKLSASDTTDAPKPQADAITPNEENKTEAFFVEAIKKDPKNPALYEGLAKLYISQNNFLDAKDVLEYLSKHDPANAGLLSRLAFSHFRLKNYVEAEQKFKQSLALDSSEPSRYYNLGLSLKLQGKTDEAKEAFQKAFEIEPENEKYKKALEL